MRDPRESEIKDKHFGRRASLFSNRNPFTPSPNDSYRLIPTRFPTRTPSLPPSLPALSSRTAAPSLTAAPSSAPAARSG